ncbi:hypothetical protein LY78DRAFT_477934 [Colletotrichum sublineola]|nr:hypothetical protein LY78DRAFT_477934 [Colletotrichum sublineola]
MYPTSAPFYRRRAAPGPMGLAGQDHLVGEDPFLSIWHHLRRLRLPIGMAIIRMPSSICRQLRDSLQARDLLDLAEGGFGYPSSPASPCFSSQLTYCRLLNSNNAPTLVPLLWTRKTSMACQSLVYVLSAIKPKISRHTLLTIHQYRVPSDREGIIGVTKTCRALKAIKHMLTCLFSE